MMFGRAGFANTASPFAPAAKNLPVKSRKHSSFLQTFGLT
jgi:hypothetical protein